MKRTERPHIVDTQNKIKQDKTKQHNTKLLSSSDPRQLMFYLTHILTLYPAFYLTYILTFHLAFYLTYILTFYLAFFVAFYLTSCASRWGPAVPTDIWSSRLKFGSAHWDLELAVEIRGSQRRSRRRRRETPLIKSRDPHLAGGEKT